VVRVGCHAARPLPLQWFSCPILSSPSVITQVDSSQRLGETWSFPVASSTTAHTVLCSVRCCASYGVSVFWSSRHVPA